MQFLLFWRENKIFWKKFQYYFAHVKIANEIFFGEFQILCEGAQNVPLESKR